MPDVASTSPFPHNQPIGLVDDRPEEKVFRVSPQAFTDTEIFEDEMRYIFERTWIYLGLANDIPNQHDFLTSRIGRVPILVTRGEDGQIRAFHNICRHRGAIVCRIERGNSKLHLCPYHHWTFGSDGNLVGIKEKAAGDYPAGFFDRVKGLVPVARIEIYNGLIFGSLNEDVPTLDDYLGDMKVLLDLIMDQSALGMETIPGRTPYIYRGNWKLQAENALDVYHIPSTHVSMLSIQSRKQQKVKTVRSMDWENRGPADAHVFNFKYGHAAYVGDPTDPERLPLYKSFDQLKARVGDAKAKAMLCGLQLQIFPNLQLASAFVPIIRKFNPLAADSTEMEVWCLGAIGETPEQRTMRLRQFEDFFNPTGLATPDDCVVYEYVQMGAEADSAFFEGYSRGMGSYQEGPNARAKELGLNPEQSLTFQPKAAAEIALQAVHREWARLIQNGKEGRAVYG